MLPVDTHGLSLHDFFWNIKTNLKLLQSILDQRDYYIIIINNH